MLLYLQRNQVRTQMPRQSRKKSFTGIYHVMLRGINKQDIFEEAEDYVISTYTLDGKEISKNKGEKMVQSLGEPYEPDLKWTELDM